MKIEAVSNPADPDDALNSSGALLPGPHATLAGPTFAEWLDATRFNRPAPPAGPVSTYSGWPARPHVPSSASLPQMVR